jgi:hypothetical protein
MAKTIVITLSSVVIDNNSSVLGSYAVDSANRHVILSRQGEKRKSK